MRRGATITGIAALATVLGILMTGGKPAFIAAQDGSPVASGGDRVNGDEQFAMITYRFYNSRDEIVIQVYSDGDDQVGNDTVDRSISLDASRTGVYEVERISYPNVGDTSFAFASVSDEVPANLRTMILWYRDGDYFFRIRAQGEDPLALLNEAVAAMPEDAAKDMSYGATSIDTLLPTFDEMPPGYYLVNLAGTPTP